MKKPLKNTLENSGFVIRRLLLLSLTAVFLTGCSKPEMSPLPPNATILAFGDSLTAGVGADPAESYPAQLADLTGFTVINSGISGETTRQGLNRLPAVLETSQPDLVILLEGGNDILRNLPPTETKNNLAEMIALVQSREVPVVLLGVPEKSLFSSSAPFYKELASDYGLVFEGELVADLLRSPSAKSDQVHFNARGYRLMAEAIRDLLDDTGAL